MMKNTLSLLAAGLLVGNLAAQSVIPDGFATVEGNVSRHLPGYYAPGRVQSIYDAALLKAVASRPILGVSFRRDGTSTGTFLAHTYIFTIHLSSVGVPAAAAVNTGSYVANQGTDWTQVLNAKNVSFGADPLPSPAPAPFTVIIPFDKPFLYINGNNLLIQYDTNTLSSLNENYYWYQDAQNYPTTGTAGTFAKFGTGCPSGATLTGSSPAISGATNLYWYWYSSGGFSTPALAFLGLSNTALGPLPLPFDLAGIGAPGCFLNADPVLAFPGLTDATGTNGRYRVDVPIPRNPLLPGAVLYGQTLVFDSTYNAAGIRASEGVKFVLGGLTNLPQAHFLYSYSGTPPYGDAPAYKFLYALIVRLD